MKFLSQTSILFVMIHLLISIKTKNKILLHLFLQLSKFSLKNLV